MRSRTMGVSSSMPTYERLRKDTLPYQAVGENSTTSSGFHHSVTHESTLYHDLVANAAAGNPPKPQVPAANQRTNKKSQRIIRKRDRKITACTQCRERKLKCDRIHPCSHCQSKGEDCFFVKNASDLQKAPKRQVKKRKRAINVCWHCRSRKIPCDKGHPCSHCEEDGFECFYKQLEPGRGDGLGVGGGETDLPAMRNLNPATQRPLQNLVHGGHLQTSSTLVQKSAPVQHEWNVKEDHKYHQVTEHPYQHLQPQLYGPLTMPFPPLYGYSQDWGHGMSFADYHTNDYEDEGYGSLTAGVEYQKDNSRTVLDNTNHEYAGPNASQQYSSPYYTYSSQPTTGDSQHHIQSLPPLREMFKRTSSPYADHRKVFQHENTRTQNLKRTSSPYLTGHNAVQHNCYPDYNPVGPDYNPVGTLPSMIYSSYPFATKRFTNGNVMEAARATAHTYGS